MSGFGARLKALREAKGMTPYRLAQQTGLSLQGVLNLEKKDADPKLSTLYRLADALGVDVQDLLPGPSRRAQGDSAERKPARGGAARTQEAQEAVRKPRRGKRS